MQELLFPRVVGWRACAAISVEGLVTSAAASERIGRVRLRFVREILLVAAISGAAGSLLVCDEAVQTRYGIRGGMLYWLSLSPMWPESQRRCAERLNVTSGSSGR